MGVVELEQGSERDPIAELGYLREMLRLRASGLADSVGRLRAGQPLDHQAERGGRMARGADQIEALYQDLWPIVEKWRGKLEPWQRD